VDDRCHCPPVGIIIVVGNRRRSAWARENLVTFVAERRASRSIGPFDSCCAPPDFRVQNSLNCRTLDKLAALGRVVAVARRYHATLVSSAAGFGDDLVVFALCAKEAGSLAHSIQAETSELFNLVRSFASTRLRQKFTLGEGRAAPPRCRSRASDRLQSLSLSHGAEPLPRYCFYIDAPRRRSMRSSTGRCLPSCGAEVEPRSFVCPDRRSCCVPSLNHLT